MIHWSSKRQRREAWASRFIYGLLAIAAFYIMIAICVQAAKADDSAGTAQVSTESRRIWWARSEREITLFGRGNTVINELALMMPHRAELSIEHEAFREIMQSQLAAYETVRSGSLVLTPETRKQLDGLSERLRELIFQRIAIVDPAKVRILILVKFWPSYWRDGDWDPQQLYQRVEIARVIDEAEAFAEPLRQRGLTVTLGFDSEGYGRFAGDNQDGPNSESVDYRQEIDLARFQRVLTTFDPDDVFSFALPWGGTTHTGIPKIYTLTCAELVSETTWRVVPDYYIGRLSPSIGGVYPGSQMVITSDGRRVGQTPSYTAQSAVAAYKAQPQRPVWLFYADRPHALPVAEVLATIAP